MMYTREGHLRPLRVSAGIIKTTREGHVHLAQIQECQLSGMSRPQSRQKNQDNTIRRARAWEGLKRTGNREYEAQGGKC